MHITTMHSTCAAGLEWVKALAQPHMQQLSRAHRHDFTMHLYGPDHANSQCGAMTHA